ncbi:MAG: polysulfide reductase NrfD [Chloroflexota bacterium]|nr:polysulfide reductase NrfD [Chloroflexota bacterium]
MSRPSPSDPSDPSDLAGYYGQPAIHGPHWNWLIIGYFFTGGISGGAAALAASASVFGDSRSIRLRDHAVLVSFAALLPCPVFLILDLGRPARFHHMVRAFRPSSPMSMGTWGLAVFSGLETACAAMILLQWLLGNRFYPPRLVEKTLLAANGVAGLFLAGYTGPLLAATAVPLWSRRPGLLGPLFLSSAISSGCAATAISLHAGNSNQHEGEALAVIDATASLAKAGLLAAWVMSLGDVASPVNDGLRGRIVREGCVLIGVVASLAIEAATSNSSRWHRAGGIAAATLSLAGTLALRYAVVSGGRASATDPQATFNVTR